MKRNENIIPLSRDHHFGLLFSWKLRKGIQLKVDSERIRKYIAFFWENNLAPHFRDEEQFLFVLEDDAPCNRALSEHKQITALADAIIHKATSEEMILALADTLDQHIRYEERELFPYLEQQLPAATLATTGTHLSESHAPQQDQYEDEFWVQ